METRILYQEKHAMPMDAIAMLHLSGTGSDNVDATENEMVEEDDLIGIIAAGSYQLDEEEKIRKGAISLYSLRKGDSFLNNAKLNVQKETTTRVSGVFDLKWKTSRTQKNYETAFECGTGKIEGDEMVNSRKSRTIHSGPNEICSNRLHLLAHAGADGSASIFKLCHALDDNAGTCDELISYSISEVANASLLSITDGGDVDAHVDRTTPERERNEAAEACLCIDWENKSSSDLSSSGSSFRERLAVSKAE